eukprot:gene17654-15102_t
MLRRPSARLPPLRVAWAVVGCATRGAVERRVGNARVERPACAQKRGQWVAASSAFAVSAIVMAADCEDALQRRDAARAGAARPLTACATASRQKRAPSAGTSSGAHAAMFKRRTAESAGVGGDRSDGEDARHGRHHAGGPAA